MLGVRVEGRGLLCLCAYGSYLLGCGWPNIHDSFLGPQASPSRCRCLGIKNINNNRGTTVDDINPALLLLRNIP